MENKKGLSTIVVTLIIIVLSLVAVGVVWAVVNNLLKSGTQGADSATKCLSLSISATNMACTGTTGNKLCTVTLSRSGTGTDAVSGVSLFFYGFVTATPSTVVNSPAAIASVGDVSPLRIVSSADTGIAAATNTVNKVDITPYFTDSAGKNTYCATTSYTF
jgi:hypothetical protein